MVDRAEAARASRMRFTKRRNEYLVREVRRQVRGRGSRGAPRGPGQPGPDWSLNRMTGAPFVEVDGRTLGLDISLTDRAGWAVCLVGRTCGAVVSTWRSSNLAQRRFVSDFLDAR